MIMKRVIVIFFTGLTLQAFASADSLMTQRDSIVCFASDYLGTPYLYAGTSPKGFDCTGFVYYVFNHFGIKASRASSGYENLSNHIEQECAQPGDIILFTGTDASVRRVGHAGIVYQNDNGILYFIHSSSSKNHFGVTITRLNDNKGYLKRYLRIIDILTN